MKKTYMLVMGCLAAVGLSGCATTQQTASASSDRTRTAHTVPGQDHSHEVAQVGWTVELPSDMP